MLESVQGKMLRDLLEVPMSTPYLPLLLETGMWSMEGRISYKKLMLFHNKLVPQRSLPPFIPVYILTLRLMW